MPDGINFIDEFWLEEPKKMRKGDRKKRIRRENRRRRLSSEMQRKRGNQRR